jgi:hypothetical protein
LGPRPRSSDDLRIAIVVLEVTWREVLSVPGDPGRHGISERPPEFDTTADTAGVELIKVVRGVM